MSLGETISRLRAQRGLSQEALADALGVSRQSVSKWETNASVPDLDKLVKLSELFEVTLDELVRGEAPPPPPSAPAPAPVVIRQAGTPLGKIAGISLLCTAALIFVLVLLLARDRLAGLILSLPFLACGLICLCCRRRAGLWCAWTVFCMADLYLRTATGVSWRILAHPILFRDHTVQMAVAGGQLLCLLLLLGATLFSFRKTELRLTGGTKWLLLGGWGLLLALSLLLRQLSAFLLSPYYLALLMSDWVRIPLFVTLLTATFCWWNTWRRGAAHRDGCN